MKIGTVLELKTNSAIIITRNSKFFSIKRKKGMYIGQQIIFNSSDIIYKRKTRSAYFILSAACIIIMLVSFYLYTNFNTKESRQTYAILEFESNDVLTLHIDKNGEIISCALKSKIKNQKNIHNTKSSIIKKYLESQTSSNKKDIALVISSVLVKPDSSTYNKFINKTKETINSYSHKFTYIKYINLKKSESLEAQKNNLSMAKYYAYLNSSKQKDNIKLEQFSNLSIKEYYNENKKPKTIADWNEGIIYKTNEKIKYNGKTYLCLQNHISQNDWTPEVAVSLWKISDSSSEQELKNTTTEFKGKKYNTWYEGIDYKINDEVIYNNNLYICIQAHKSQSDWTPDITPALWKKLTIE